MSLRVVKKIVMFVLFLIVLAGLGVGGSFLYNMRDKMPEGSVCKPSHAKYEKTFCDHVGKKTYIVASGQKLSLGTILGVAWRARGDVIGGMGKLQKRSDRNRYYYMISKDEGKNFVLERVQNVMLEE